MRPNITSVAKLAGVSVATVSNVITGKKYVSPELTARVKQAIEELDYQPNMIARGLKSRKTNHIGVVVPDITNPYFAEITRGIDEVAVKHGYQIFLCNTDGRADREKAIMNTLISHDVDGIISVAPRLMESEIMEFVVKVPFVIVDRMCALEHENLSILFIDNFKGGAEIAAHFYNSGHRKFACIGGPLSDQNAKNRLDGFCHMLKQFGIDASDILIKHGEFRYDSGYQLMDEILESAFKPTAVFAGNDLMAWGAHEAVKARGLSIPDDIALSGFDNIFFSAFLNPALTTVNQPKFEMGQKAMEMLLRDINKEAQEQEDERKVMLDCELIVRDSG
ncbi:MAG TPA: LacI family transcriptional regulator [Firmicutes bacterium]|nr:LacI family transcriptional regulator [Bacillota bacterium]